VIAGEGETVVHCPPDRVLEFVMDLDRYRQADRKIGRVYEVVREGPVARVRFRAKMLGLPGPKVAQVLERDGDRLTVRNEPSWMDRLYRFEGLVACRPAEDGATHVRHVESFEFRRPWSYLLEPLVGAWLRRDTPAEVRRLHDLLEQTP